MEQHGQRTTGREENSPLEELRLEVSDGESSMRWGWGARQAGCLGDQRRASEISPKDRHS